MNKRIKAIEERLEKSNEYLGFAERHDWLKNAPTDIAELLSYVKQLEGALADACDNANMQIVTLKKGDIYSGIHKFEYDQEAIVMGGYGPGEVCCTTAEAPELTAWLQQETQEGEEVK